MELKWINTEIHRNIAVCLKEKGYVDEVRENGAVLSLIIEREEVFIPMSDFSDCIGRFQPFKTEEELFVIIQSLLVNIRGGRLESIKGDGVLLKSTEMDYLSVRIPKYMKLKLRKLAVERGTNMSEIVIEALKKYLEKV